MTHFQVVDDSKSPVIKFECKCKETRTQNKLSGYSNLVSHVEDRHPDYLQRMQQTLDLTSTYSNAISIIVRARAGFQFIFSVRMDNYGHQPFIIL